MGVTMTLTDLRALALAATPGPWYWDADVCAYDHEQEAPWLVNWRGKKVLYGQIDCDNSASADLIEALSPERILALLDVIEAAKAMRGGIAECSEKIAGTCQCCHQLRRFDAALAALEKK